MNITMNKLYCEIWIIMKRIKWRFFSWIIHRKKNKRIRTSLRCTFSIFFHWSLSVWSFSERYGVRTVHCTLYTVCVYSVHTTHNTQIFRNFQVIVRANVPKSAVHPKLSGAFFVDRAVDRWHLTASRIRINFKICRWSLHSICNWEENTQN